MTPSEYYQQKINAHEIKEDAAQSPAIKQLDRIFHQLVSKNNKPRWLRFQSKKPIKGLYLWGHVGIAKTFLMDCFYHCLPLKKMRMHFHRFLLQVHVALKTIQGEKNPLEKIAKQFADKACVICFDEFFVSDIADAMILGELFHHLFGNGVTLVATSNISPDLLYKEGLQRERFVPAIKLIKKHTEVLHLQSNQDYRLEHIHRAGVYYTPLGKSASDHMQNTFAYFSKGEMPQFNPVMLCDREVPIIQQAGSAIWFEFEVICGRPRSQLDYLAITKSYRTIFIQNLREIKTDENDLILSFIFLVDILYDAHCQLVISSAVLPNKIYGGKKYAEAFQRTVSRLIEMQSETYVANNATS